MTQPALEPIQFTEAMMPSERRAATLGVLQRAGRLTYWGTREGCWLVERDGKLTALTDKQVDWLTFAELVMRVLLHAVVTGESPATQPPGGYLGGR